jgi:hypothetical protein
VAGRTGPLESNEKQSDLLMVANHSETVKLDKRKGLIGNSTGTNSGSSQNQIYTFMTQAHRDGGIAFDPLQQLDGARLKRMSEARQSNMQQKIDKSVLTLCQGQQPPRDWCIRSMIEINLTYAKEESEQALKHCLEVEKLARS